MNSINYNTRRTDNVNLHDACGNISDQLDAIRSRRNFIFINYQEVKAMAQMRMEHELALIYGKSIFHESA